MNTWAATIMLHTNEDRNSNIILLDDTIQMFINYSNPGKPMTYKLVMLQALDCLPLPEAIFVLI